jgi:excisionase family DNA binding protein
MTTNATPETEFLTVAEFAERLRLSAPTVYRRVQDGTIPAVRLTETGAIRIPRDVIESRAVPASGSREAPACAPRTSPGAETGEPLAHGGGPNENAA